MYKILLCHRRRPEIGYQRFHRDLRENRSRRVLDLHSDLGYYEYSQLHQLPRRNLLYRGIQATRGWVVTTFLSAKQGRDIPPRAVDPGMRREERWDVIEQFRYPSRDALLQAWTSDQGRKAVAELAAEHVKCVRRTAVIVAEEFVAATDAQAKNPRIGTMFCLRAPAGMARKEMLGYWGTSHKQLVLSLHRALGYRAYDQLHCRGGDELTAVVDNVGGTAGDEFDGVALLAYGNQFQLILGFLNPFTQIANLRLVRDEIGFIDGQRSSLIFGREYRFTPQATT